MAQPQLQFAIEEISDLHSNLFLEPHVVAFVAVATQYSSSPARFQVECGNLVSRWLGKNTECLVDVTWQKDTAEKAQRLRGTMQSGQLVELASVGLAMILAHRVVPLGQLDVTDYGGRADYRARKRKVVLEVSGTEDFSELNRRHRQKVLQAGINPFGWDAYVVVCTFAAAGHRIRFSKHPFLEAEHGEGEG
jgi:hypothetical protein